MTLKIPSWLIFSTLIGLGILIFASIRGCNQGEQAVAEINFLRKNSLKFIEDNSRLVKERDSTKKEYQDSLDFINGQLELKNNQLASARLSLDSEDKPISDLIKRWAKYKYIQPLPDTATIVTVPPEYVDECQNCFTELQRGQQKVKLYLSQLDSAKKDATTKDWLQEKRIIQLSQQNTQLAGTLHDCIDANQRAEKKLSPHGQLYFSWSVLWVPYLPKMAGIGLMYQNRYRLQIGVRGMFGQYGNGFETEVNMPLSLKRRQ